MPTSSTPEKETIWDFIKRTSEEYRERLAREGYKLVDCEFCNGTGYTRPGYSDRDAHGSFWVEGRSCPCGFGRRKVAISKEEQAAAMRRWLEKNG